MLDRLLADLILTFHLAFIVFAVVGGLLVLRWRWLMFVHLPAVAWAVVVELMHWPCPLTRWENHFLERSGAGGYEGGFIDHYLIPVIYPDGLTPNIQIAIGVSVFLINTIVYGFVFLRPPGRRKRPELNPPSPEASQEVSQPVVN